MMTTADPPTDSPLPALRRDIEIVPIEHEGKPMFVLQDLDGFSEKPLAISPQGLAIVSLLDGHQKISDLRSLVAKQTGALLQDQEILNLVAQLEQANLLETPELRAMRQQMLEDFLKSPIRKARQQGIVYPKETLELAGFLGAFLRDPKGPGKPMPDEPTETTAPHGLIAPHIDFHRGGAAYAWAYRALAECPPPDLIVAVGVAHAGPNSPWTTTAKSYATPHGALPVDADLHRAFKDCLWYDPTDEEWLHMREHSLEPQAVWLKFLWRDKTPPWLPVLCTAFERFCPDKPPSSVPTIEDAIQKIGQMLAERKKAGQKIMVLAAVDLAHVGPRFGDDIDLNKETEARIESEDRKSLDHALQLNADDFYLSVVADGHWRKVCGLSALYTALRWIKALGGKEPATGKLLTYAQASDAAGGIVSFASGIFS